MSGTVRLAIPVALRLDAPLSLSVAGQNGVSLASSPNDLEQNLSKRFSRQLWEATSAKPDGTKLSNNCRIFNQRPVFLNYINDIKWFNLMVGETGFEPATLWSQTRCATRLRYSPTWVNWYNNVLPAGFPSKALKGQRLVGPEGLEPPT
jgi:hypothetical protein